MPDPTSLTEYADHLVANADAALATGRARATAARDAEGAAGQAVGVATAALTAQTAAIAALRRQLAAAETPADAETLAEALGKAVIGQRAAAARLAAAQLAKDEASGAATAAAKALARIGAEGAAALAAAAEKAAAGKRAAAVAGLGRAPASGVRADAQAVLAGPAFADARTKVEADIPAGLRDRATAQAGEVNQEARRRQEIAAAAQAALDGALEEGGLAGDTIPRLRMVLDAAAAELQAYVDRAATRLGSAHAIVERLAGGKTVLTDDQRAALADPARKADRDTAAGAEKDRDEALATTRDKDQALEITRDAFRAADPAGDLAAAEADNTTPVGAANEAAGAAAHDLQTAETAFTQAQKDLLAEWRADAPEAAWSNLTAFVQADQALQALMADPAPLAAAVTVAEGALLTALLERDKRVLRLTAIGDDAAARTAAAGDYARNADRLRSLVLRGVAA